MNLFSLTLTLRNALGFIQDECLCQCLMGLSAALGCTPCRQALAMLATR